jgi:hypothetical protein
MSRGIYNLLASRSHRNPKQATRAHWSIENNPHWQLDITFDEDRRRSGEDFSPLSLAVVRHAVLNILKRDGAKMSLQRKRVKAASIPHSRNCSHVNDSVFCPASYVRVG